MNTKWEGLWAQGESGMYAGYPIKKKDIPPHTRIMVRFNESYIKDSKRPRFVYCFADSEGYKERCADLEYVENLQAKVDKLAEVMHEGYHNADVIDLPSETQARASALLNEAISIIEDITGEKWTFSYLTFY